MEINSNSDIKKINHPETKEKFQKSAKELNIDGYAEKQSAPSNSSYYSVMYGVKTSKVGKTKTEKTVSEKNSDKMLEEISKMYNEVTPLKFDEESMKLIFEDKLDGEKLSSLSKDMTLSNTKEIQLKRAACNGKNNYVIRANHEDGSRNIKLLDKDLNILEQESTTVKYDNTGYPVSKKVMSTDFRTNTFCETKFEFTKERYPVMVSAVKIRRDNQNRLIRKETYEKSDVDGMFNVKYEFPNGKVRDVSKVVKDKTTGAVLIEKDMRSPDMTRTQYRYEDDPNGNRIIDYKITSPDGKVLMNQSQSFEVLGENKFRSSRNDRTYFIELDEKTNTLSVTDEQKKEKSEIKLQDFVNGDEKKISNMLKTISGDELINLKNNVLRIDEIDEKLRSYCKSDFNIDLDNPNFDSDEPILMYSSLAISDDPFVFLHELGHATDVGGKPFFMSRDEDTGELGMIVDGAIRNDKDFKEIYEQERQNFLKEFPTNEMEHINYFIADEAAPKRPQLGKIETIAETNALLNTYQSTDVIGIRTQYLQQHFPRTIAYLSKKLTPME